MGENRPPVVVTPETEDLRFQLAQSRQIQTDADDKADKADQSAREMSRMLRRLAEALDANPSSWDALFGMRKR